MGQRTHPPALCSDPDGGYEQPQITGHRLLTSDQLERAPLDRTQIGLEVLLQSSSHADRFQILVQQRCGGSSDGLRRRPGHRGEIVAHHPQVGGGAR